MTVEAFSPQGRERILSILGLKINPHKILTASVEYVGTLAPPTTPIHEQDVKELEKACQNLQSATK